MNHVEEVLVLQKQVRSMGSTFRPSSPPTAEEVRLMFSQYHEQVLNNTDVAEIVAKVNKHSWNSVSESFTLLFQIQCSLSMTYLLEQLEPLVGDPVGYGVSAFASDSVKKVPRGAWSDLLRRLVSCILQSSTPSSRAFSSYYAFSDVHVNDEWLAVSRFVATHCTVQDQEAVAAHLGTTLSLYTLNHLITHLPACDVPDGPLQERLRHCAVQRCVDQTPPLCDVKVVVEWVVREHHTELLTALRPVLQNSAVLIVEPAVRQELGRDTQMSEELRQIVHARIGSLHQLTFEPAQCWRLSPDHLHCSLSQVRAFLASDLQTTSLKYVVFGGRKKAFKWAKTHRSRQVSGIAARGVVIISKNDSAHQAAVKRCAKCKKEIRDLCKLLHTSSTAASSVISGVSSDGSV